MIDNNVCYPVSVVSNIDYNFGLNTDITKPVLKIECPPQWIRITQNEFMVP